MDLAGRWDLVVEEGSTFERYFRWEDSDGAAISLTGYTLRMTIRPTKVSSDVLASTESSPATITISQPGAAGVFKVAITAIVTRDLDFVRGRYDIEAYTAGDAAVARIVQGNVALHREATR